MAERDAEDLLNDRFTRGRLNGLAEARKLAQILLEHDEKANQVNRDCSTQYTWKSNEKNA